MERKYTNIYDMKQIIKGQISISRYKMNYEEWIELLKKYDLASYSEYNKYYYPKYSIRLMFIAYGLLRNKPYSVIETPKECNRITESQWKTIHSIIEKFKMMKEVTENA